MPEPAQVIIAKYRVVTPMFLSGADPNCVELRLPSFKGALRFWWRALAARHFAGDIKELRNAEDALFGSTRTGVSRVRMRLAEIAVQTDIQQKFPRNSWQSYIGFGLIDKPGQTSRPCIQPDSTFTVELVCARCTSDEQRKTLRAALVALGLFGGLGGRSRNGWGSLTLECLMGLEDTWHAPADVNALEAAIASFLGVAVALQDWTAVTRQSRYAIGPVGTRSEAAHRWLAQRYQNAIKNIPNKPEREAFGLPRKHTGPNAGARRASPGFLHVHQAEGAKAIPVALFLPGKFLAQQAIPKGDWRIPQVFFQSLGNPT
jgi:CRISPR-associated protein Cmr1